MNETKKMKSIARRMNRKWAAGLFAAFLFFDILAGSLALGGWCYFQETGSGQAFRFHTERRFQVIPGRSHPASSLFLGSAAASTNLGNTYYLYQDSAGREQQVYAGRFLIFLWNGAALILLVQAILLLGQALSGTRKIRKYLAPLDEMAVTAKLITNAADFDEGAFHDLEHAISEISPTTTDAYLHTGNTELKSLEEAVNSLLDRMRESYRQQDRFVSNASHELRTPIAVIQGYADMLSRWGKEDETVLEESIAAIKGESDHMKKLVEQLLFLARGDSGKTKLAFEPFSLAEMIREVWDESVMIDPGHTYRLKDAAGIVQISGDSSMIKQAARILVDNAAKYTPEKQEITLWAGSNEKGDPCFTVQDEGIGIGGEDISHIFERFYRSGPARGRESGGAGLGLSIAKWIVDRHQGYFQLLSREDIGTRITVCFPQNKSGPV